MLTSNISVNLLDVLLYRQNASKTVNPARSYSALSFRVNSESEFIVGSQKIPANTGSIALVPGGVDYERISKKEEAIVFHFEMFGNTKGSIEVFQPSDPEKYKELFSKALKAWEEKKPGFKYKCTAFFYEILAKMQSDGEITELRKFGSGELTAALAKEQMDLHFSDCSLSISSISDSLFVSESYMRRVFEKYCGISPKKYLDNVRIAHARSLLDAKIFSQKEIAQRCGYEDVKYFRTVFRKKMGINPSEYKYEFLNKQ